MVSGGVMQSDGHRPAEDELGPVDYLFEREKARILNG
jgi:hypothetical protein